MGAKNLTYPESTSQALRHDDYFMPLDLKLDAQERDQFFEYYKTEFLPTIDFKKALYSPMGNAARHFPKTVAQTREFLGRIGLTTRNLTVFVAPPTHDINDARNIHVDSVKDINGNDSSGDSSNNWNKSGREGHRSTWECSQTQVEAMG